MRCNCYLPFLWQITTFEYGYTHQKIEDNCLSTQKREKRILSIPSTLGTIVKMNRHHHHLHFHRQMWVQHFLQYHLRWSSPSTHVCLEAMDAADTEKRLLSCQGRTPTWDARSRQTWLRRWDPIHISLSVLLQFPMALVWLYEGVDLDNNVNINS